MTDGYAFPTDKQSILIINSSCDQSVVTTNTFIVDTYLDKYYELNGTLQGGHMEAK